MRDFFTILRFGFPYLRRYWLRFALGICFGFVFGLSNGFTMGGIYLMLTRLQDTSHQTDPAHPEDNSARTAATNGPKASSGHFVEGVEREFKQTIYPAVDPWLPLRHRPLDWKQWLGGLFLIPLLAGFRGLMNYLTTYLLSWASQRISNDVKEDVFRKINSLSLEFFHRSTTAELISRITDDTTAVSTCLRLGLSDMVKEPTTIIVLFAGLLFIDWKLTLIAVCFTPLCLVPTTMVSRKIKSHGRKDNAALIKQVALAIESFQNVRVTKAYELGEKHAQLFRKAGNIAGHFLMKNVQARATLNPLVETLNALGISAVLFYSIYEGIDVKVLGTFLFALIMFYAPFKKLGAVQIYFMQASLAMERLMKLFQEQPSVRDPVKPSALSGFARSIEFRNIDFSYDRGPVLANINFTLSRGRRLGLAGESGSGKSSLINLLFRFYDPTAGDILLDGLRIDSFRIADLRFQMALVSQDILLFDATVEENIAFGRTDAKQEEIVAAAREAYAHDFITALPDGYATPIGEHGVRLSGGQRQRLAIARAFVRNAPILVLDEATASLDSQSEAEVQRAIDHLAENRTVICVAHRLSTLRATDEILVLSHGRIVERGGFDELLDQGGRFTEMAARQSIFPQSALVQ
jgi:ABC-type multidrug transport system fused ATPase/permease subunit